MIFLTRKLVFVKKSLDNGVWTGARRWLLLATVLLLPLCYQARPKPVGRIPKPFFPCAKFTRQVFCSFLSAPMCGKSRKHSFNTWIIVYLSISCAWTPHDIFLSDRNDPLWECWYNLSNLTNQRAYQELVHRNGLSKEMITGSPAPSLPSFLLFYFHLRALSIQRAQLSRSLEQAMQEIAGLIQGPEKGPHKMAAWLHLRRLKNTFPISTFFLSTNDTPFFKFFFHNCLKNN